MTPGHLFTLAGNNLKRSWKSLLISGIGVMAGIGSLIFLVALGSGTKEHVLNKVFVIDYLEVVPRSYDLGIIKLGGGALSGKLDNQAVKELEAIPGVSGVYPKMRFSFKAMGSAGADLIGRDVYFELFADGIDPGLVKDELGDDFDKFKMRPEGEPIPILISPQLVEFFNSSVSGVFNLPKLTNTSLVGIKGTFHLGRSISSRGSKRKAVKVPVEIVGLSNKALLLGATIPLDYVKAFNKQLGEEDDSGHYSSTLLKVDDPGTIPGIVKQIEQAGFELDDRSEDAIRAGNLISILMLIFSLISLTIISIAAISIAQTFMTIVGERSREIGIMRALGATKSHIRNLILLEAGVGGAFFGVAGIIGGVVSSGVADLLAIHLLPDFPFKPAHFFQISPLLLVGAFVLACTFSLLGAIIPARRAASLEPAQVLTPK